MKKLFHAFVKAPRSFWRSLTKYEKCYYVTALTLALVFAFLFPQEDVNGHNGKLIMALCLLYTALNVTCELQISKQSRWNFVVSFFIELTEIAMYLLLAYRFATMATVIFFWIPIDILSFVSWSLHPDRQQKSLTEVRSLKGWQEIAVIAGIVLWTVGIGTLLCRLTENLTPTELFEGRRNIEVIVCYLDAMVSALDIANGSFILLRYREQWIAWYLEVIIDAVCLVLAGQYVLLVLTAAYLTNTTYGYIKWTKYIRENSTAKPERGTE